MLPRPATLAALLAIVWTAAWAHHAAADHAPADLHPPRHVAKHAPPDTLRFAGTVHRDEIWRHPIGGGLEFRLTPMSGVSSGAWDIGIWPVDSVPIDYAAVATPPYRSINPRDIEGWHFRNRDNTGSNRGDVNAPQDVREFLFVENRVDLDTCWAALERVMWPYNYADAVVDHAAALLESLATGSGALRITSLFLTPPGRGEQATIDSMRFEVTLAHRPRKR